MMVHFSTYNNASLLVQGDFTMIPWVTYVPHAIRVARLAKVKAQISVYRVQIINL